MPNTTTLSASILIQDVGTTPATTVVQRSLSDQQTALAEYDAMAVVLPAGTLIGAPMTINLGAFKPKTVYIYSDRPFQMKIGAGADIHKIRSCAAYTFGGSEPTQLLFATGTGVTVDTNLKIILGSAHP